MIATVVALLMFWNGEIKEHRIQSSMADCLRARRVAEREFNPNVSYKCIRSEAETEIYMGENQSKNSTSNKVAKELKDRRYHQRVVRSKKIYDRKKIQSNGRDS